jgi:hypothetical protein
VKYLIPLSSINFVKTLIWLTQLYIVFACPEVSSATVSILEQTLRVEFVDLPPILLPFMFKR